MPVLLVSYRRVDVESSIVKPHFTKGALKPWRRASISV